MNFSGLIRRMFISGSDTSYLQTLSIKFIHRICRLKGVIYWDSQFLGIAVQYTDLSQRYMFETFCGLKLDQNSKK